MGLLLPHFYYLPPNFAELTVNLIKNFGIYIPHICIISVFKHTHTYMQKYQQAKVIFNVIPIYALEKEMATHSSVLAWKILGRESLVSYRLWGRTESDTTEAT